MPAAPTYEDSVFADGYEFFNQSSGFLGLGDINAENTIFSLQFDNRWIEDETEKKEIRKKEYDELNADADNYDDVVIEAFGEEY